MDGFSDEQKELILMLTGGETPIFASPSFCPVETANERFFNETGFSNGEFPKYLENRYIEILLEENAKARKEMDDQLGN